MIEYRITRADDSILNIMGKDNRQLIQILEGKMYWSKQIKVTTTREANIDKESAEWLEFINFYRTINKNGSYDKRLIAKYHKVIKETPHEEIMQNLNDYRQHLEAHKKKEYALQVGTYLNRSAYKNTWELVKVDYTNKWKDDILRDRKIPEMYIDAIMTENNAREATHGKVREMTAAVFNAIIDKYYKG